MFSWSGRFLIWNWSFLIIDNRLEFVVVVKILFILIVYYCHFHVCLLVYWKFKNEYFSFSSLDYNHWKHWNEFQSNFLLSACYHCLMFIFNWIYCDTVDDMMVVVDHFFPPWSSMIQCRPPTRFKIIIKLENYHALFLPIHHK